MDIRIHERFHQILKETGPHSGRVLEIGGLLGKFSLLTFPELGDCDRTLINLAAKDPTDQIATVQGNSNDMSMFESGSFSLVMSNAVIEHDKYFWKSLSEMKRILKPGGNMVIGVPAFGEMADDKGVSTKTFKVHFSVDYYRFSLQAVRDVFFEGFDKVSCQLMLNPPRAVGFGYKPMA